MLSLPDALPIYRHGDRRGSPEAAGDHSDWRPDRGDDPDPPRFAGDRKGGARCNRRQAPQARRTSRAERTRAGVKEKIMTEAIKLLRIYTDEGAYRSEERRVGQECVRRVDLGGRRTL